MFYHKSANKAILGLGNKMHPQEQITPPLKHTLSFNF